MTAVVLAFVAALWPDVREAVIRAVVALLSVGAAAWLFNLVFLFVWRNRYDRVKACSRLLEEAADYLEGVETEVKEFKQAAGLAIVDFRIRTFLRGAFRHQVLTDFDAYLQAEEHKANEGSTLGPNNHNARVQEYLRDLAGRLAAKDMDDRFLLPLTFRQYADTEHWPVHDQTARG